MQIKLNASIKSGATIIEGFPGFGLVGTITTEYLIDHLNAKQVGSLYSDKIPPIIAIHEGEVIEPLAIFYDSKSNIIILRAIANISGLEWQLTDSVLDLAKKIKAKELISLEGIGGQKTKTTAEPTAFYFSTTEKSKKRLKATGLEQLREGIVIGNTASLLSKAKDSTFIFVESCSELPDSGAAAKIIEVLDKYLNLKVDYKPLIEKADKFERKVRDLILRGAMTAKEKMKRESESYIG